MRGLVLSLVLTAAASAQPVLSPDSVAVLADRAAAAGLIPDSTASSLASCARLGLPLTRSAVADAAVRARGVGPIPNQEAASDPLDRFSDSSNDRWLAGFATRTQWNELAVLGLLADGAGLVERSDTALTDR